MRLLLALIYIGSGAWAYIALSAGLDAMRFPLGLAVGFALLFSSTFLFNRGLARKLKRQSWTEHMGELEAKGKLIREQYAATRAMHCEDLSTGCAAYFIDVGAKGTVLLHGQDYNYEPLENDDEPTGQREFPTSNFTLSRKVGGSEILDIEAAGTVIEPEELGEPEPKALYGLGIKIADGIVVQEPSYENIRSALKAANNSFKPNPLRRSVE